MFISNGNLVIQLSGNCEELQLVLKVELLDAKEWIQYIVFGQRLYLVEGDS